MDDPTATATVTVTAQPDNPYDRNALEVKVNEKAVGFIARKDQTRAVPYLQHGTAKASILDWGVGHEGNLYVIIGL